MIGVKMIDDDIVKEIIVKSAEMMKGIGYAGEFGSVHLLDLGLQSNQISSIFHGIIAWNLHNIGCEINSKGQLSYYGKPIRVITTSDKRIKANRISSNAGFHIVVKYTIGVHTIKVNEILVGYLGSKDWNKRSDTQFAFISAAGERSLRRLKK